MPDAPRLAPLGQIRPAALTDESARTGRTPEREALVSEALQVAARALRLMRDTLEGDADFEDAVKALPLAHKVLEHVERLDAASRTTQTWQVAHFEIVTDPSVPQAAPPRLGKPTNEPLEAVELVGTPLPISEPDQAPQQPAMRIAEAVLIRPVPPAFPFDLEDLQ